MSSSPDPIFGNRPLAPISEALLSSSPDAIVALDQASRIVEFNLAAEQIFGYSRLEAIGRSIVELLIPQRMHDSFRSAFLRQQQSSAPPVGRRLECVAVCKDGHEVPVEVCLAYATLRLGESSEPSLPSAGTRQAGGAFVIGFVRDLTSHKRAEAALHESEQRLALALELAHIGTWDWNLADNTVLWSPLHALAFGYPPTVRHASYEMWRRRTHPDDVARVETAVHRCLQSGERYHCEYRAVWPDGSVHWVEGMGEVVWAEVPPGAPVNRGKPVRMIGTIRDVTERKLAELELRNTRDELERRVELRTAELRQSEQQYRLLAENASDTISRHSPGGVFLYASPGCRSLLGYEPHELVGKPGFDLIHPDDMEFMQKLHEENLRGVFSQLAVCRARRKDGTYVWVEFTTKAIRDSSGTLLETVAVARDVTARKQAEDELKRNFAILNGVMEGTTDAVFVKNRDGRYLTINSAGAELIGMTRDQVTGKDDTVLFSPETARAIMAADAQTMAGGVTRTYEETGTAAGATRVYHSTKGPFRDSTGQVVGLIGISRDITQRKADEVALRRSEAKFRAMLEAMPDGVFRVTRDGTIVEFGGAKGFEPFAPPEQFIRRSVTEILPADVAHDITRTIEAVLATYRSDRYQVENLQYSLPMSDGPHDYEARFAALDEEEAMVIVRDVTERNRIQAQVHRLLGELSRATRITTLGGMASGLAHQLNQPLTVIANTANAAVNLLRAGDLTLADAVGKFERVVSQAMNTSAIVQRIRGFVTNHEPRLSSVDINALVRSALNLDRIWRGSDAQRILPALAEDLPWVQADRVLLEQVLINLIGNACEATATLPAQRREIVVETSRPDANSVRIAVRDWGPGIPPERRENLFEPFQSSKPGGLGLGLFICHSILAAHHSKIGLHTVAGEGTTFYFDLPIR